LLGESGGGIQVLALGLMEVNYLLGQSLVLSMFFTNVFLLTFSIFMI
jgi:hypothetical protein